MKVDSCMIAYRDQMEKGALDERSHVIVTLQKSMIANCFQIWKLLALTTFIIVINGNLFILKIGLKMILS